MIFHQTDSDYYFIDINIGTCRAAFFSHKKAGDQFLAVTSKTLTICQLRSATSSNKAVNIGLVGKDNVFTLFIDSKNVGFFTDVNRLYSTGGFGFEVNTGDNIKNFSAHLSNVMVAGAP